jgi:UDPglucose 6-dehydrogenase
MRASASIGILGSGTVGSTVGKGLLKLRNRVIFYDISEEKVKELRRGGLDATCDLAYVIENSQIAFVCVPTPVENGKIDLTHIEAITKGLAECLEKTSCYRMVVIKSTVVPTTTEKAIVPMLEKYSAKKVGAEIGLCVNPEFMTEIHGSWTDNGAFARGFFSEPVIVIGEFNKESGDLLQRLYQRLRIPIVRTNPRTAEMIKYAFNCALATRISYWNEIFYACKLLDIDSDIVAKTVVMDSRIGKYGAVHGMGFGGKCLPKDLRALLGFLDDLGYDAKLLRAVEDINKKISADRGIRE